MLKNKIETLKKRAEIIKKIRAFFYARNLLEVETPLLSRGTITDANLNSFPVTYFDHTYYLQTSPEFHMKRLLAEGSGSIFQISKAFRYEEYGQLHNPEFTMLEWYQIGFNHHDLMREMDDLLQNILSSPPAEKKTYRQVFEIHLNINPLQATINDFKKIADQHKLRIDFELDHDGWLNLLMSYFIEPHLGLEKPIFIYDYPASQSALAKINPDNPQVAERFEVYVQGIELANGFHELTDALEQRQRFEKDIEKRKRLNLPSTPIDENFLRALEQGLPNCAGVALGVDRLIMLALGVKNIGKTTSFSFEQA